MDKEHVKGAADKASGAMKEGVGKAEEIASTVSFLASDGSGFMTGSTLTMNGAQYIT